MKEVKSVGPFLAPFFKTSCVYFILTFEDPTLIHAFVKVLPMLCLICFVFWIHRKDHSNSYNKLILSGLILCASGDVVILWQDVNEIYFLLGMVLFALGHLSYMLAFGFRPFGLKEFVLSVTIGILVYSVLFPGLPSQLMTVAVGIYNVIITIMVWRAVARFNLRGEIPWRKVYAAIGAISFILSDTILGINKFIWKMPHEKEVTMIPYYLAQMGIALSVINSRLLIKESNDACLK